MLWCSHREHTAVEFGCTPPPPPPSPPHPLSSLHTHSLAWELEQVKLNKNVKLWTLGYLMIPGNNRRNENKNVLRSTASSVPIFPTPHNLCPPLLGIFVLIFSPSLVSLSPSLLGEYVLLGRADSSYLAAALWTIKIWFQSPAGCWAWGLGSQLQLHAGRRQCTAPNQMAIGPLTLDSYCTLCALFTFLSACSPALHHLGVGVTHFHMIRVFVLWYYWVNLWWWSRYRGDVSFS